KYEGSSSFGVTVSSPFSSFNTLKAVVVTGIFFMRQARHNLPYRRNSCKLGSTVDTTMKTPEH
ncbi:hypothetical protein SFRURICE_018165, partial [Spodoptera frugiperda]